MYSSICNSEKIVKIIRNNKKYEKNPRNVELNKTRRSIIKVRTFLPFDRFKSNRLCEQSQSSPLLPQLAYLFSVVQFKYSTDTPHDGEDEEFRQVCPIYILACIICWYQSLQDVDRLHDLITFQNLHEKRIYLQYTAINLYSIRF